MPKRKKSDLSKVTRAVRLTRLLRRNESAEVKAEKLKKLAEARRARRAAETPEQRELRLKLCRIRQRQVREARKARKATEQRNAIIKGKKSSKSKISVKKLTPQEEESTQIEDSERHLVFVKEEIEELENEDLVDMGLLREMKCSHLKTYSRNP